MIVIDNTIVSDNLYLVRFNCDVGKCKGACCIEGDAGAPLEEEEISILEDKLESIKPFMSEEGITIIEKKGVFDYDSDGNYVTPLIDDKECAFTNFDRGIAFCSIEKAYNNSVVKFKKPISCHLYPIRVSIVNDGDALNFHQWEICKDAMIAGSYSKIPLYKSCKESLIRKYGPSWYNKLEIQIQKNQKDKV